MNSAPQARLESSTREVLAGLVERVTFQFQGAREARNGVIHDMTNFPEDTILYFTNFGPIRYIDDDNNTVGFLDWQGVMKAAEEGAAKVT